MSGYAEKVMNIPLKYPLQMEGTTMRQKISDLDWPRILIGSILVTIVSIGLITLIVMNYAFMLGFEARGAPDQAKIERFAETIGPLFGPIFRILLTLVGAAWVARRAVASPVANGVAFGVVVAGMALVFVLVIKRAINFATLRAFVLTVIAGLLGGLVGCWLRSAKKE
jgi:hypothetical protein